MTTAARTAAPFRGAYDLTEDQDLFRRTVREFAAREVVPIAAELDEKAECPRASISKMGELGLMGLLVPEEYGGAGASTLDYALAIEEISWADASHSVVISVNNSLVCEPILRFGTEEHKRRFLTAQGQGDDVRAYCFVPPTFGSDAHNLNTPAEGDREHFVPNRTQAWCS